jgi:hypothetical protein
MKHCILVAVLCFGAINLLAQPNNSPPKYERNGIGNSKATSAPEHDGIAATNAEETKNSTEKWYTALKGADWWLVIIAALTGLAIAYQAREMTRATEEMKRAGDQAAKHLELTERPWVSPRAYIISPLTADENGIHITFRIELANVGNSPAIGIWIEPSLYLQHVSKPSVVDERKRICEQVIARSPKWGQILFPKGDPHIQDFTINATTEDIAKSKLGLGKMPDVLAAAVILCVAYRSTIDDKAKHYTATIYDLTRFNPQNPNLMFGFMAGESIPQHELRMSGSIFGPIAE